MNPSSPVKRIRKALPSIPSKEVVVVVVVEEEEEPKLQWAARTVSEWHGIVGGGHVARDLGDMGDIAFHR